MKFREYLLLKEVQEPSIGYVEYGKAIDKSKNSSEEAIKKMFGPKVTYYLEKISGTTDSLYVVELDILLFSKNYKALLEFSSSSGRYGNIIVIKVNGRSGRIEVPLSSSLCRAEDLTKSILNNAIKELVQKSQLESARYTEKHGELKFKAKYLK